MCGIAGIVSLDGTPIDVERVRSMAKCLNHRGPDDEGTWTSADGQISLGHRRLSIVDLSVLGRNPMLWDGGRLAITYNGEVYNFLELRGELEREGYRFRTQTDTEVILAAYDRWGLQSIDRFVGMFAFALWDQERRRLWIARDRLGKKPLYYHTGRGSFRFASELKGLLTDAAVPRAIDSQAIAMYLRYGYVPAPHSIYSTVRKLEPGHYLICEKRLVTVTRYWHAIHFAMKRTRSSTDDAIAELDRLLSTAVRQRLIADVPLGAFLSGGIDSSLVVALMQEQCREPVRTFTIRFADKEFNEADHAAAVARHLGTDHYEELCAPGQMLSIVERLPSMFDEPFGDSSAIPTFLVSAIARKHVTVVLSGDGGDEIFLGYPRYRYYEDAQWLLALPAAVRRLAAIAAARLPNRRLRRIADVLNSSETDAYGRLVGWWSPADVEQLTGAPAVEAPLYHEMAASTRDIPGPLRPSLIDLVSYLPDDILTKVDRASMAVGLEVRAPFLDHRVVEFALGLPLSMKRRGPTMKWILRALLYKRVPKSLVDRPKMGFGVPLRAWLSGPLRERMDAYTNGPDLEELGLNPSRIRTMWQEFKATGHHRSDLLWQIFVLVAWSRQFNTSRIAA